MQTRAAEMQPYWENYQQFVSQATGERDDALRRIRQQQSFGGLSPDAAGAAMAALEQDYEDRMTEIQAGPTYELLMEEYEAQREFAESQYNAEAGPAAAAAGAVAALGGGDRAGRAPEGVTEASLYEGTGVEPPAEAEGTQAAPAPFEFASFEDFWSGMAEAQEGPTGTSSVASQVQKPEKLRMGGQNDPIASIGVGETYDWY